MGGFWAVKMSVEAWISKMRSPSTITSQLTHTIPPKSTLIGLLMAKVGLMRDLGKPLPEEYIKSATSDVQVAVSCNFDFSRKFFDYVLFHNKEGKNKPTKLEYLIRPRYDVIYLFPQDHKFFGEHNKEAILNQEFFKPYLGSNESLISDLFVEEIEDVNSYGGDLAQISTKYAVRADFIESIDYSSLKDSFIVEELPVTFPWEKKLAFSKYLVPTDGKSISIVAKKEASNKVYFSDKTGVFMVM